MTENYWYKHERTCAMLCIPAKSELESAKILKDLVFLTGMWKLTKQAKESNE